MFIVTDLSNFIYVQDSTYRDTSNTICHPYPPNKATIKRNDVQLQPVFIKLLQKSLIKSSHININDIVQAIIKHNKEYCIDNNIQLKDEMSVKQHNTNISINEKLQQAINNHVATINNFQKTLEAKEITIINLKQNNQ